jgi:DNA-binding transcriptional MerR regulator
VRLEEILALKYLGLSLHEIKRSLSVPRGGLTETLRRQRIALEEKRLRLDRAIRAVRVAEEAAEAGDPDPQILKNIIEVIDVEAYVEAMRKYYSDEAWEKDRPDWERGPLPATRQFFTECAASLDEDPASARAQALFERWVQQTQAPDRDPVLANREAWMDRDHWPESIRNWTEELRVKEIMDFFMKAAHATRSRYFDDATWAKLMKLRTNPAPGANWNSRVNFFSDVEKALTGNSTPVQSAALAQQWQTILEKSCGGDTRVKAAVEAAWRDRQNRGAFIRGFSENISGMPYERFVKVADFLDQMDNGKLAQETSGVLHKC